MSCVNIHDAFVPIYIRTLQNVSHLLSNGETYAKEKGILEAEVMEWRLAPDMLPLSFQAQTVCNGAQNLAGVASGVIQPTMDDNEKTFAELQAHIATSIDILKKTTREQFEGRDTANIVLLGRTVKGLNYVQNTGLPNFFFHVSILYGILRSHGVPVGKADYLRGGSGR